MLELRRTADVSLQKTPPPPIRCDVCGLGRLSKGVPNPDGCVTTTCTTLHKSCSELHFARRLDAGVTRELGRLDAPLALV